MALWWTSIKLPLTTGLDHPNTLTPNTWTAWFLFHTNILGNETGKTFSRCEGEFDKDCLLVCPFFAKAPPQSSSYRFPPSRLFGPARITTRLCLWRLPGAASSHPKEPLPPHPSRRSPAEPPALILSSSCLLWITFLIDFGNWLVRTGNSPFPFPLLSNPSNACFQGTCVQDYGCFPQSQCCPSDWPVSYCLVFNCFCIKLSVGEISLFIFIQRSLFSTSVDQRSEPYWWFTGNDASCWERSSFPGAAIFSEMAFILNWLVTVFLACLVWHNHSRSSLLRSQGEPRAAGAVARICSPEAAAGEGAISQALQGFPIAVTAHGLQNVFAHLALGFAVLRVFLS